LARKGFFCIALAGGIAKLAYEGLKERKLTKLQKWYIVVTDETLDGHVNYERICKEFATPLAIPKANVLAVTSNSSTEEVARKYEVSIRDLLQSSGIPEIDLVVLELGNEGSVCSLFPNSQSLEEKTKLVAACESSPKGPENVRNAITLTFTLLNNAKAVAIVATGLRKSETVNNALEGVNRWRLFKDKTALPAARVENDKTHWLIDKKAARHLMGEGDRPERKPRISEVTDYGDEVDSSSD